MDPGILTALIVAVPTIMTACITPIILSVLGARQRKADKIQDYQRQDSVAALALAVATKTNEKLEVIHKLVNSNLTAALQAELNATIRELALMKEIVELKRIKGQPVAVESLEAIELTQARIVKLSDILLDRTKQAEDLQNSLEEKR